MTASITFDDDDNAIAGIWFSVDYDQTCLSMDGTGSVEFNDELNNPNFTAYALFDSGDTDAEIDINIFTWTPGVTVSDGVIVKITFTASDEEGCPGTTAEVGFSSGTTFHTGYKEVDGWTQDGSVKIADE